ncbi:MAG: hypothetical protein RJA19_317 [Bacteroidota bacterium]
MVRGGRWAAGWATWAGGALLLAGCQPTLPSPSSAAKRPYDWESQLLHPRLDLVPTPGADSKGWTLFWEVDRSELLYLRASTEAPFVARFHWTSGATRWEVLDTLKPDLPAQWRGVREVVLDSLERRTEGGGEAEWVGQVTDAQRGAVAAVRRPLPPANPGLTAFREGWPVDPNRCVVGDTLQIWAGPGTRVWVARHQEPAKLPAPPFSYSGNPERVTAPVAFEERTADEAGWLTCVLDSGTTLITRAQAYTPGNAERWSPPAPALLLHARRKGYPRPAAVPDLIAATRYITSRTEFERMEASDDPKAALDKFWMDCGRDEGRSRQLIEIYYARVEEANRYFGGRQEGWRTDRGMVHVVLGPPTRLRRTADTEWWTYGEEGQASTLTFVFERSPHPFDDNHWVLNRALPFRPLWDRSVTAWRNGRVQRD